MGYPNMNIALRYFMHKNMSIPKYLLNSITGLVGGDGGGGGGGDGGAAVAALSGQVMEIAPK